MLFVHFRTVKELYLPAPGRRERLTKSIALAGKVPVVVNGDFNTPADFKEAEEMGAAGVMTARGWVRDPALFLPGGGDLRQAAVVALPRHRAPSLGRILVRQAPDVGRHAPA